MARGGGEAAGRQEGRYGRGVILREGSPRQWSRRDVRAEQAGRAGLPEQQLATHGFKKTIGESRILGVEQQPGLISEHLPMLVRVCFPGVLVCDLVTFLGGPQIDVP